ncbi:2-amino-3-ketobutyrate coenzyme A ligase [Marinicella pacifica]|uniref:2-amino-3-ketobutyrate coenzyme A ligase n=1 Tax=Marinicella pacifica TaxID=1171543 RepID=A0A917CN54_9GAMM|nr:glycine C-acetyltransferase [Marinicella pacifica]GGF90926.1 2-amino-3-ketobutyrate coenzyme A ligase [Marinicella pacifica]
MQEYQKIIDQIKADGLYKKERIIVSPQSAHIELPDGQKVLNFCANNYLGLANHPAIIQAAKKALDSHGFGMASVRFICGTQDIHKQLEAKISEFFGTEDTILYTSCFDANGGLFETILNDQDAVISDQLNHASIIDGIRLCKAQRHRYANCDMSALEDILQKTQQCERRLIVTDGVFSMDGRIAPLKQITDLAKRYHAMVVVDDSHATGFVGRTGRGSAELEGVLDKVDIFTSTLGKALGGASGGFTTGKKEVIELLRQRSRPYLFSNTLPPPLVAASIQVLDLINESQDLIEKLKTNTDYFRQQVSALGFTVAGDNHPITPIMLGDARLASDMADRLLELGVYCIGFSYPVVPKGEARIRLQISAAHSQNDLDLALNAFKTVKKEFLD